MLSNTVFAREKEEKRVVIVGAGTGSVSAALTLERLTKRRGDVHITLIDARGKLLFGHLLRDFLTGRRREAEVNVPLRVIFEGTSVEVVEATVIGVDRVRRRVDTTRGGQGYDYLILAPGETTADRDIPGAGKYAFTLDTMDDANELRSHVVGLFEQAAQEKNDERRKAMLTLVISGSGVQAVELGILLSEWVEELRLRHWVPTEQLEIVLVAPGERTLPNHSTEVEELVEGALTERKVRRLTDSALKKVSPNHAYLEGGVTVPTKTIILAGPTRGAPLFSQTSLEVDDLGFPIVDEHLRSVYSGIYALGGAVNVGDLPKADRARVSQREGRTAARNVFGEIAGAPSRSFRGDLRGYIVYLGEERSLAVLSGKETIAESLSWFLEKFRYYVGFFRMGGLRFLSRYYAWLKNPSDEPERAERKAA